MADLPIVLPHGGYKKLEAYRKSDTIYQGTVVFCRRFLPKSGDRTVDQMVQAARSCKQNIAEGSAASGTSKETEIKLTNVARASLDELFEDYEDYLKANGLARWPSTDRRYIAARQKAIDNPDWKYWQPIFESRSAETLCNLQLTPIRQTQSLLDGMIKRQEAEFKKVGGVRERMHAARTAARGEDWDKALYSRLDGAETSAELDARAEDIRRRVASSVASIKRRKGWG
jgi:four helix bundle suffix protein